MSISPPLESGRGKGLMVIKYRQKQEVLWKPQTARWCEKKINRQTDLWKKVWNPSCSTPLIDSHTHTYAWDWICRYFFPPCSTFCTRIDKWGNTTSVSVTTQKALIIFTHAAVALRILSARQPEWRRSEENIIESPLRSSEGVVLRTAEWSWNHQGMLLHVSSSASVQMCLTCYRKCESSCWPAENLPVD